MVPSHTSLTSETAETVTYPRPESHKLQASKERWSNSTLRPTKLDIPAKLQVGAGRAAVHTTKIILALTGMSKQQSRPFMARAQINIAERKVEATQLPQLSTDLAPGCRSLPVISAASFCAGKLSPQSAGLLFHCFIVC